MYAVTRGTFTTATSVQIVMQDIDNEALDVWILDSFQIKTLTHGIKPPTLLPTTHGIRTTYFSVNKDTDNSGG